MLAVLLMLLWGAGYIVKRVLGNNNLIFPNIFGVLFLLSFGFPVVFYVAIRRSLAAFMRESCRLVWENRDLGRLLMSRRTIGFGAFAASCRRKSRRLWFENKASASWGAVGGRHV